MRLPVILWFQYYFVQDSKSPTQSSNTDGTKSENVQGATLMTSINDDSLVSKSSETIIPLNSVDGSDTVCSSNNSQTLNILILNILLFFFFIG